MSIGPAELNIANLNVQYQGARNVLAVDGVDLTIGTSVTIGLVGESGSGKSTLVRAVLRLLPQPSVTQGVVTWRGENLLAASEAVLRDVRLREIAYVPQASMNSLNPVVTVGNQFVRILRGRGGLDRAEARARAQELCEMVELEPAVLTKFSHQLSGGMRQRLVLAMALSLRPHILIADEATTGLDVLVQKTIIDRLRALQKSEGFTLVFVSHDLALIGEIADVIVVMYAGRVVEIGQAGAVYDRPLHPYSMGLRRAVIDLGRRGALEPMAGFAPSGATASTGCPFAPRCWFVQDRCVEESPELRTADDGPQQAACHFVERASEFRMRLGFRE